MALAAEAGELFAEFQWLTAEETNAAMLSAEQREAARMEVADISLHPVSLADSHEIDLYDAALVKLSINEDRFPKNHSLQSLLFR